jgi:hypothetical protein
VKLHFLVPSQFGEQLEKLSDWKLGTNYPYWLGGRFNWAAQSYLVLRQYREGLTIGNEPRPGIVNLAHVDTWRHLKQRRGEFRVSIRADYPRLYDIDFEILQNPVQTAHDNALYLPYWPVPGLISRDLNRKGVKNVCFAGRPINNNLDDLFESSLLSLPRGIRFSVIPPEYWHDLSSVDVLVAIRDFDKGTYINKPPSKLYAAWLAGIPLIAGWDSAYAAIGVPGIDYIRVADEPAFYSELLRLVEDPSYYLSIVENGASHQSEISHEAIAQIWLAALDGPIVNAMNHWQTGGSFRRVNVMRKSFDSVRSTVSALTQFVRGD